MCSLHRTQGLGVRPARCSAKKSASTVRENRSLMSTTSNSNPTSSATARASDSACGPQHPWSTPSRCTSFRCDPRTRYPCSCSSAAATEESTPPLIATRTEGRSLTRARLARPSSDPGGRACEQVGANRLRERRRHDVGERDLLEEIVQGPLDREPHVLESARGPHVAHLLREGLLDPRERALDRADHLSERDLPGRPGELEPALL